MTDIASASELQRWRLVLGRFAEPRLGGCGGSGSKQSRMDRVLDYLYGREYRGRGVRGKDGGQSGGKAAAGDSDSRYGGDAENVCEHVVTAILAYQVSLGKRQITVEQAARTESSGAADSKRGARFRGHRPSRDAVAWLGTALDGHGTTANDLGGLRPRRGSAASGADAQDARRGPSRAGAADSKRGARFRGHRPSRDAVAWLGTALDGHGTTANDLGGLRPRRGSAASGADAQDACR